MKKCELCKAMARIHCESDQASLCWDCDAMVHSANFLVARHSRSLLCHVCQSPTSWSASGGKLRPTVSICEQCVDRGRCDDSDEEETEEEEVLQEEIVEENQVVPWSPPPAESSSSMEEAVSVGDVVVSRKRFKIENCSSDHESKEEQTCTSSRLNICDPRPSDSPADATETLRHRKTPPPPLKYQKLESGRAEVCGSETLDLLTRFHPEETGPGQDTAKFCASPRPSI